MGSLTGTCFVNSACSGVFLTMHATLAKPDYMHAEAAISHLSLTLNSHVNAIWRSQKHGKFLSETRCYQLYKLITKLLHWFWNRDVNSQCLQMACCESAINYCYIVLFPNRSRDQTILVYV